MPDFQTSSVIAFGFSARRSEDSTISGIFHEGENKNMEYPLVISCRLRPGKYVPFSSMNERCIAMLNSQKLFGAFRVYCESSPKMVYIYIDVIYIYVFVGFAA